MTDFTTAPPAAAPPAAAQQQPQFDPLAYVATVTANVAAASQVPAGQLGAQAPAPAAAPTAVTTTAPWWQTGPTSPAVPVEQPPTQNQHWWNAAPTAPPQAPAQQPPAQLPSYMQQQEQPQRWIDPATVNNYGLTPEQQQRYAGSLSVIEQIANAKMAALEEVVRQRVSQLDQRFGTINADNEQMFMTQVDTQISDLQELTRDPAWGQYLASRPPMSTRNVKELVVDAYQTRDLRALKEIAAEFRQHRTARPTAPTTVQPSTSGFANVNPVAQPQGQILPLSAHSRATRDFVNKRITQEQFDAVDALYRQAEREHRVDYNA